VAAVCAAARQTVLFKDPANRNRAISLTAEEFRDSFGNALDEQESDELYERWSIPAPSRPLFEAAEEELALYLPYSPMREEAGRSPSFVVLAGKDQTVPPDLSGWALARGTPSAATDVVEFADRGHSLTIDSGWREIAETCIDWLWNEHNL
jgi:pimeloyl-ACP methyl ester carboxylesterase